MFNNLFSKSSRAKSARVFLVIILLFLFGVFIDFGEHYNNGVDNLKNKTNGKIKLPHTKNIPYKLGLDLQGGTHLVYKADLSQLTENEKEESLKGVRDVIERRVNVFGVSEPLVQVNKTQAGEYQVIVELAGVSDVNEAIQMIGETPLLEFKEFKEEARELTKDERDDLEKFNRDVLEKANTVLDKLKAGEDFSKLAKEYSDDTISKENNGELDWLTKYENSQLVGFVEDLAIGSSSQEFKKTNDGYEILKLIDKRVRKDPFTEENKKEIKASHILICYKYEDDRCDNGLTESEVGEKNKNLEEGEEKLVCTKNNQNCNSGLNKEEALQKIKSLKNEINVDNFYDLARKNSTEPGADSTSGSLGWFTRGVMVESFEDAVYSLANGEISDVVETSFGYHLIYKEDEKNLEEYKIARVFLQTKTEDDILGQDKNWQNTELSGKNLKRSLVQFDPNSGIPVVSLEFDKDGSKLFEEITSRNIGKQVAIFLDNVPVSAPKVNEKITGGSAVISGNFNIKTAKELARYLNAGALPVPIDLISQKTVGATLGKISIEKSLQAGVFGLILVIIFMILFYRLAGVLAVFSLMIYGVLVLACFKFFGITLTLSGLAGFILSIGMAVDANILIFERIKEELRSGKYLASAIEDGFIRAWSSIRDGNFSTLITCIILVQFSTSIVRGFAITLIIGVIISMFSAIIVTRNFLRLIGTKWLEKRLWLLGVHNKK